MSCRECRTALYLGEPLRLTVNPLLKRSVRMILEEVMSKVPRRPDPYYNQLRSIGNRLSFLAVNQLMPDGMIRVIPSGIHRTAIDQKIIFLEEFNSQLEMLLCTSASLITCFINDEVISKINSISSSITASSCLT